MLLISNVKEMHKKIKTLLFFGLFYQTCGSPQRLPRISHTLQPNFTVETREIDVSVECRLSIHENGFCIPAQNCNLDYSKFNRTTINELRCGPRNRNRKKAFVCCERSKILFFENTEPPPSAGGITESPFVPDSGGPLMATTKNDSAQSGASFENFSREGKLFGSAPNPLPSIDQCGNWHPPPKITGGKQAELDDFPWMALIRTIDKFRRIKIICEGSLITEKYVLTAAHCLHLDEGKKGKLHSVVLGEYDIRSEKDCIAEGDCADPVQKFSIHSYKTYRPGTHMHDDIGLVRLNGTADLSTDFVKPICLPPADFPPLRKDDQLWISGWSRNKSASFSDIKLNAQISYLTKEDCYKKIFYRPQNNEICAGSDNKTDACRGGSGGPLMTLRNYNNTERIYFLVGISSWGIRCEGAASIYTNVFQYRDWILENIRK